MLWAHKSEKKKYIPQLPDIAQKLFVLCTNIVILTLEWKKNEYSSLHIKWAQHNSSLLSIFLPFLEGKVWINLSLFIEQCWTKSIIITGASVKHLYLNYAKILYKLLVLAHILELDEKDIIILQILKWGLHHIYNLLIEMCFQTNRNWHIVFKEMFHFLTDQYFECIFLSFLLQHPWYHHVFFFLLLAFHL